MAFAADTLEARAVQQLRAVWGDQGTSSYRLTEDVYDEEGDTRDPGWGLYKMEMAVDYLRSLDPLPDWRSDTVWTDENNSKALHIPDHEFLAVVARSYERATGLPVDGWLLHSMGFGVWFKVWDERHPRQDRYRFFTRPEIKAKYQPVLQQILVDFDPQGVVAAGIETDPYRREALYLIEWIRGGHQEGLAWTLSTLLTTFYPGEYRGIAHAKLPEIAPEPYLRLAECIQTEVVKPMRAERVRLGDLDAVTD